MLAPINWRLVFLISVPVGIFGTVWAYRSLRELSTPQRGADRLVGQRRRSRSASILVMIAVTYGIRPAAGTRSAGGARGCSRCSAPRSSRLVAFVDRRAPLADPMFRLPLFRIRAFTFGTLSTFLSAVARGGLMFMLIIWLQGIWLPQHGYSFTETPLWAGIYMLPLTVGLLLAGPISGYLSDRFGARPFATGGMLLTAVGFGLLLLLPTNFSYPAFALILLLIGDLDGAVRLAQPRRGDEQPAARRPRRRRRDEPDVPELRPGAVDRHLLHADDHRAGVDAAADDERRPAGPRRLGRRPRTASRCCRRCRSCSPRSSATTRSSTCSAPTCSPGCRPTTSRS